MLHTLRQIIDNDEKWRGILRGLNEEFYHQTVKGKQVEDYIAEKSGLNLNTFFDQYLRDTKIPTFEYAIVNGKVLYRWANCVEDFNMKLKVHVNEETLWLSPGKKWQNFNLEEKISSVTVDKDFYVASFQLTEIK